MIKIFPAGKTDRPAETVTEDAALVIVVIGHWMAEEVKGNFNSGSQEAAPTLLLDNHADQLFIAIGSSLRVFNCCHMCKKGVTMYLYKANTENPE